MADESVRGHLPRPAQWSPERRRECGIDEARRLFRERGRGALEQAARVRRPALAERKRGGKSDTAQV